MKQIVTTMMDLIANEVCKAPIEPKEYGFTDEELEKLYELSKSHDLAHLVGDALIKNDLISNGEIKSKFEKQIKTAIYRYENINYELNRLKQVINEAEIPFISLKGSVIRQYYPEPWMRTSCDIDILVHEDDLNFAIDTLCSKLSYKSSRKNSHDVGLIAPGNVHIELHYNLIEEDRVGTAEMILERVWDYAVPINNSFEYSISDDMYYYYHIAHMAKHFQIGGCGVRPFIDIWVLNNCLTFDKEKRESLLENGGLLVFAKQCEKLAEVWFDGGEHTEVTRKLENYILGGGVYGNVNNRVAVQQVKKGGKFKYALSRIWLPYDVLKFHYPSLEGKKILLPFYEIRRWGKLLFKGGAKRSINELSINSSTTPDKQAQISALLCDLGLHDSK